MEQIILGKLPVAYMAKESIASYEKLNFLV